MVLLILRGIMNNRAYVDEFFETGAVYGLHHLYSHGVALSDIVHQQIYRGDEQVSQLLQVCLEMGFDPTGTHRRIAVLVQCLNYDYMQCVIVLIEYGAKLDQLYSGYEVTAHARSIEMLSLLLTNGAGLSIYTAGLFIGSHFNATYILAKWCNDFPGLLEAVSVVIDDYSNRMEIAIGMLLYVNL